jgi:ribosomal protein S18 acetylase RimI-like enzyme
MSLNLRLATLADYPGVSRLADEILAYHARNAPDLFTATSPAWSEQYYQGILKNPLALTVVAADKKIIAGLVSAYLLSAPDLPMMTHRRFVNVDTLSVLPEYQRRGIGRQLMQAVEGWAQARGACAIELNAYAFNDSAQQLYTCLGYKPQATRLVKGIKIG